VLAIRLLAALGTLVMAAAIVVGFATASFTEDGAAIVALVWGRVTLIDIYLAFLFGWLWIAWRERSPVRAAAWAVATVVTGSLALFGYLLLASLRSQTIPDLVVGPHRRELLAADATTSPRRR
jgi:membrane protease YdiL (CAAX protease family)